MCEVHAKDRQIDWKRGRDGVWTCAGHLVLGTTPFMLDELVLYCQHRTECFYPPLTCARGRPIPAASGAAHRTWWENNFCRTRRGLSGSTHRILSV